MSSCLFAWILAIAVVGCAYADEPESIVSGTAVRGREFPYIVSIRVNGNHYCGGSLVSRQHVLTAAHCLVDLVYDPTKLVTVVTGSNYLGNSGQSHYVSNYFYHDGFDNTEGRNWYNDIGLIKLRGPVQFNAAQNMIRLPDARPPVNVFATVAGWGASSGKRNVATETLQKADFQMIPTNVCQQYFEIEILNSMICTLKGINYGTCSGDSGGPLVYNNRIVGVVSGGIPCALGYPDIFTNVYAYLNYIDAWMRR